MSKNDAPLVTAIVSTYASERFIEGCLANLVNQSIFDRMEVIVVDADSPEDEGRIVKEYQKKYPNIRYIRTPERIGIYPAWNIGVREARGKYLTNANTDDRRHPRGTEKLVQALEDHPEAVLAYSDIAITGDENREFGEAGVTDNYHWLDHSHTNLMRRCEAGPMPVWRASLHEEIGLFDERYIGAGDYEFWLRASERHSFIHLSEVLGVYLRYDNNLETRNMQRKLNEEYATKSTYIRKFLNSDIPADEVSSRLKMHSAYITENVARLNEGITADELNEFESHYYSAALMLAKSSRCAEAVQMLEDWLRQVNPSKNIGHLLYNLLLSTECASSSSSSGRVGFVVLDKGRPELLGRTLESILNQQHPNREIHLLTGQEELCSAPEKVLSGLVFFPELADRVAALPEGEFSCHCAREDSGLNERLDKILRNSKADYLCVLQAGNVLTPSYITEAAFMLDTDADAGWISPKAMFFGMSAVPAWGADFSMKHALAEPPAVGAGLFRAEAYRELPSGAVSLSEFENWGLWLQLAFNGWTGKGMNSFGVIRNMFPEENIMAAKQKTLHGIVAANPGWYRRDRSGGYEVQEQVVAGYESAADRSGRRDAAASASQGCAGEDEGRFRLVHHYLRKENFSKASEQLQRILADNPDDLKAKQLLAEIE